jgi:hypothetical protein
LVNGGAKVLLSERSGISMAKGIALIPLPRGARGAVNSGRTWPFVAMVETGDVESPEKL